MPPPARLGCVSSSTSPGRAGFWAGRSAILPSRISTNAKTSTAVPNSLSIRDRVSPSRYSIITSTRLVRTPTEDAHVAVCSGSMTSKSLL